MSKYIVSVSGGASSAATLLRALELYPEKDVLPVFADTLIEHPDTYRFVDDLEKFTKPFTRLKTGKSPMDVSDEQHMIFNSRVAKCTQVLKTTPIRDYTKQIQAEYGEQVYMCIGFNQDDRYKKTRAGKYGRLPAPVKTWAEIGVRVKYPLWIQPRVLDVYQYVESYGFTLPESYKIRESGLNFSANCGGTCFKAGVKWWRDSIFANREQFERWMNWETEKRKDPKFEKYAILTRRINGIKTPYPLEDLYRETLESDDKQLRLLRMEDDIASDCTVECQEF